MVPIVNKQSQTVTHQTGFTCSSRQAGGQRIRKTGSVTVTLKQAARRMNRIERYIDTAIER